MKKTLCIGMWLSAVFMLTPMPARGAEPLQAEDERFEDKIRNLGTERNDAERLRYAKRMIAARRYSSLQVKDIASRLGDDAARLEFALAAYPQTVDPENFYEVYDAFRSFSKVMRLHDSIRSRPHPVPGPMPAVPQPLSQEEFKGILDALRKESFDKNKLQLARQILSGGGRRFLSAQVKQIVQCLDFEPGKLEIAKFAYDYTLDRERYYVVNDAFSFASSKDSLSQYLESRTR